MARVIDLNIPAGFEYLFNEFLTLKIFGTLYSLTKRRSKVSKKTQSMIAGHSLFLLWQDLWGTFLIGRRDAWQDYWATLPFGTHSGDRGWPGSGYSAFVYVNAPRYALGLELLLDPPTIYGPELLISPNFEIETDWEYENQVTWSAGMLSFYEDNGDYFGRAFQPIPGVFEGGTYRIELTVTIPADVVGSLTSAFWDFDPAIIWGALYDDNSGEFLMIGQIDPNVTSLTIMGDVVYVPDPFVNGFTIPVAAQLGSTDITVTRASLRKHL